MTTKQAKKPFRDPPTIEETLLLIDWYFNATGRYKTWYWDLIAGYKEKQK
jgi:hypothetical protein